MIEKIRPDSPRAAKTWSVGGVATAHVFRGGVRFHGDRVLFAPLRARLRADGSLRAAIILRGMTKHGQTAGHMILDSLVLSADAQKSFVPERAERGFEWRVPEALARRFTPAPLPAPEHGGRGATGRPYRRHDLRR